MILNINTSLKIILFKHLKNLKRLLIQSLNWFLYYLDKAY